MAVYRRVYQYDVKALRYETDGANETQTCPADLASALRYVADLPFDKNADPTAYLTEEDGAAALSTHILDEQGDSIAGIVGRTRYDDVPQVEVGGRFEYISVPDGGGVFEGTHFVYYPARDLALFDFNVRAPRWKALGGYLVEKLRDHPDVALDAVEFTPQVAANAIEDLINNRGALGKIKLKVFTDALELVDANADELGNALHELRRVAPTAEVVTLEIGSQKATRKGLLPQSIKDSIVNLARNVPQALGLLSGNVEASPSSEGELEPFDLLQDKITHQVVVAETVNGVIDSTAVVRAMRETLARADRDADGA